jgi:D-alanine-D-alanine ligase
MFTKNTLLSNINGRPLKVWVLAPYLHSADENIDYYYDFTQSIEEYKRTFEELDIAWVWQPVTMNSYIDIIDEIISEKITGPYFPIVFNICDGDEVNGTPGISVVKLLEEKGLVFTGSDEYFYDITTSKIPMKKAFDKARVPSAPWEAIRHKDQDIKGIFERLGSPIIVKPSVSGGSMGVGIKNVVYNETELKELVVKMFEGYRGWNLSVDGLIAESFICGNEYTTLIVGAYDKPGNAFVFNPVERIFHSSLPDHEKFLSFDRLWEIYEEETPIPDEENFYEYEAPDTSLTDEIKKISWDAYAATKGKGYTRVDIRRDKISGKMYVLEVNAQCGISEDENYTSIGAILRLNGKTFTELVVEIIKGSLVVHASKFAATTKKQKAKRLKLEYVLPLGKLGDTA